MKILLLSRYGPMGASSRIRSYQYLPYFRQSGIDVVVSCLFGDDYIRLLSSSGRKSVVLALKAFLKRVQHLLHTNNFDLIWVEKEIFPWLPNWVEQLIALSRTPYIVDFDDAVFHRYDLNRHVLIRKFLGKKLDRIMARSHMVVAGNTYLEKRAINAHAKRVMILPSVIDLDRYFVKENKEHDKLSIGWIGSSTTVQYLYDILPSLSRFCKEGQADIIVVGAEENPLKQAGVTTHKWTENTEVGHIRHFDVGIMPLPDTPWTRGKCGYKLIQYMACGLPVIASPVGANLDIVQHGENGFFASNATEWNRALSSLKDSPSLRFKMGAKGRKRVEEKYCLQVTAPQFKETLETIIKRN